MVQRIGVIVQRIDVIVQRIDGINGLWIDDSITDWRDSTTDWRYKRIVDWW